MSTPTPPPLFQTITQRSIRFRNRIGISPMCQYSCVDGLATDWHLVHLAHMRAAGGAGLIIAEATGVSPEGRISPGDLGIWSDRHVEPLARVTRFIRDHGAVAGIQLAHAGWKAGTPAPWKGGKPLSDAEGGWTPLGPSPIAFTDGYRTAQQITDPALIVAQFRDAARRALVAGFELIEIHGAHGYLLHSFHSPVSNHRTDIYGGSFDNRTRLTREIVTAIREVWPDHLPLWLRLSATDWIDDRPSWRLEDSVALAKVVKGLGVDCIDCSSGGIAPNVRIPVAPGYQVPLAARVKAEAAIPTAAVGMITGAAQAQDIITSQKADFVLIARESLRDPNFPVHAAKELGAPLPLPNQYLRAF